MKLSHPVYFCSGKPRHNSANEYHVQNKHEMQQKVKTIVKVSISGEQGDQNFLTVFWSQASFLGLVIFRNPGQVLIAQHFISQMMHGCV